MGQIIINVPENINVEYDITSDIDQKELITFYKKLEKYIRFKKASKKLISSIDTTLTKKDIQDGLYE